MKQSANINGTERRVLDLERKVADLAAKVEHLESIGRGHRVDELEKRVRKCEERQGY